jgi:hypothetical protein
VIVKGTADANQVANAGLILPIGSNSLNLTIDLLGGLDGKTVEVTATNLVPFGIASFLTPMTAIVGDGGNVNFRVVNTQTGGAPSFASLLGGVNGDMIDLMRLDIVADPPLPGDSFEAGVDSSTIKLTVDGGGFPSQTQLGRIGSLDDPFDTDPLYSAVFGNMTTLTVVPEPSSFLYLGLVVGLVGGIKWYRTKRAHAS